MSPTKSSSIQATQTESWRDYKFICNRRVKMSREEIWNSLIISISWLPGNHDSWPFREVNLFLTFSRWFCCVIYLPGSDFPKVRSYFKVQVGKWKGDFEKAGIVALMIDFKYTVPIYLVTMVGARTVDWSARQDVFRLVFNSTKLENRHSLKLT